MAIPAVDNHDEQYESDPNEMIRRTVRALRGAHQVDATDLARHLKISRQSFYNRINGVAPWLAAEVSALADYFGCDVQDLYDGTVNLTRPLTPRTTLDPDGAGVTRPVTDRITRVCSAHGRGGGGTVIAFPQVGPVAFVTAA